MHQITIKTSFRSEMLDITPEVEKIIRAKNWEKGILVLFSSHTTAALTINENADPDVKRDIDYKMNELIPEDTRFTHAEGNSDSHIKTSLFGPSLTVIIENGEIQLGTWQSIYFAEWDGPRTRKVWLQFVGK